MMSNFIFGFTIGAATILLLVAVGLRGQLA